MSRQFRGMGSVFRRAGRGNWIIKWSHRGQVFAESSGSTDRAVAVKLLKQRQNEVARNAVVGPKAERLKLREMLDDVLVEGETKENRTQPSTTIKMLTEFF